MTENEIDDDEPLSSSDIAEHLAELEAKGLLYRNGKFRRSPKTGKLQPVYVVTELGMRMGPAPPTDERFAEFEAMGLIRRTGHFRRCPITDRLRPVYEVTELGKSLGPTLPSDDTEQPS